MESYDYVSILSHPPSHLVSKHKHLALPTHPPFWLRNTWMVPNAFKFHKEKLCIDSKIYDGNFISIPYWNVQCMTISSSNLGRICCLLKLFLTFSTIFVQNMFSPCSAKRRACDKDLPVKKILMKNIDEGCASIISKYCVY